MDKTIATNRQAKHEYFLLDKYEAGIALVGTEIKSLRLGNCNMKGSYIDIVSGEAYIKEMHIAEYTQGNRFNHDTTRDRKLLLHKQEIVKLAQKVKLKGFTIVPTKLYFSKGKVKLEIALAKGKELHDKRMSLKEKDAKREVEKAMNSRY
jgi:SsrA-binding protein